MEGSQLIIRRRPGPFGVLRVAGRRPWALIALIPLLALGGLAVVVALGYGLLWAVNPVGDEWVCSKGEVPTDSGCYPQDEPIPDGVVADPLGNRPMAYNCDKSGWTLIEHDRRDQRDCLNDRLPLPDGWHVAP